MKSLVFAAVVGMASACWGQQPEYKGPERIPAGLKCTAWNGNYCLEVSPIAQPAPLKCGKLEQESVTFGSAVTAHERCYPTPGKPIGYMTCPAEPVCKKWEHFEADPVCDKVEGCTLPYMITLKSGCKPDLHTVTEKEWQEMMAKIKKLEAQK